MTRFRILRKTIFVDQMAAYRIDFLWVVEQNKRPAAWFQTQVTCKNFV
jgi:hypothetical protein